MRSFVLLLLGSSLLSLTAFSQSTGQDRSEEINYYLAEGLECKELHEVKTDIIQKQEAIISGQQDVIKELKNQVMALEENYELANQRAAETASQLNAALYRTEQLAERCNRLKKGRNTWRTITLVGAAVVAGLVLIK